MTYLLKTRPLDENTIAMLKDQAGNTTELATLILSWVLPVEGPMLQEAKSDTAKIAGLLPAGMSIDRFLESQERQIITAAVGICDGNVAEASRMLQIQRGTLIARMRVMNLLPKAATTAA